MPSVNAPGPSSLAGVIGASSTDIMTIIATALRDSYLQMNEDLAYYASKVKGFNQQKSDLRDKLKDMRKQHAAMGPDDPEAENGPKAMLEAEIQALEDDLSTVGDDAQLANVDLQNALQKQQQTLQLMSNVSKMTHDTAMAVIRKIGG